ncbi:rhodanese-like domain-containing protein [uncultured Aquimarina sp.]|uniref:rhodanese-like domain-containing protein n=1 Tax=uncultured Aquimarina sp. TaxID=575652 RepID=UPI0026091E9D|nr:rhodanese-like domain-containing protein [uncultured Aquimarina sp.]
MIYLVNSKLIKCILCLVLLLFSFSGAFSQQISGNEKSNTTIENDKIIIVDIHTINEKVIHKDVQLVDIRTLKEYNAGYIDDAINISVADKEKFILDFQKLDKEKPVYIYCYSGWRSHRAAKLLVTLGFKKIYDFKGGYKAWNENPKR